MSSSARKTACGLLCAGAVCLPQVAAAVWDDRVALFVERELTQDDNVFRLSDEVDPEPVIGSSDRGDTYHTTVAGIEMDLEYSRQKVTGMIALDRVRFDRFSELDLDGHRADVNWEWVVGNRWSGNLGYAQSKVLASLANVQGGEQVNTANFLTIREVGGDARYKLTERWHLLGGLNQVEHENSSEESRISNATIDASEFGFRYVTPAGNEIGAQAERREASLPVQQSFAATVVNNSYEQTRYDAVLDWGVTADSRLLATAGRVEREHRDLPARDYNGSVYTVSWNWRASDSIDLGIERMKGISPYEQVNVGFVLLDSLTVRGQWQITEKISLMASRIDGDREYLGLPGQAGAEPRVEDAGTTRVELSYEPLDFLTLGLDWRTDSRSANVPFGDYDANILTFSIRGQF